MSANVSELTRRSTPSGSHIPLSSRPCSSTCLSQAKPAGTVLEPWSSRTLRYPPIALRPKQNAMPPPSRDARPRRRPDARRSNCAQNLLPCLKVMDSTNAKTPLRSDHSTPRVPVSNLGRTRFRILCTPAHHARALSIRHSHLITTSDVDTILTFCNVERLDVITVGWRDARISLAPLHGLFPVLNSLYLSFISLPDSEIFGLICSFPLLEDLTLVSLGRGHRDEQWNAPPTSPRFNGTLKVKTAFEGIRSITHRLLDLPNGIHFTKIAVPWLSEEDVRSTMDLASRCADTLQSLDITNHRSGVLPSLPHIPDRRLTATHRRVRDNWNRPLPSGKTPGCGVSVWRAACSMDQRDTPHCRAQEPPTFVVGITSLLRHRRDDLGNGSPGVVGPRFPVCPVLFFALTSFEGHTRAGKGRGGREGQYGGVFAGADEEWDCRFGAV